MPMPAAGGMPYDKSPQVVFVHHHRFFVAAFALPHLIAKRSYCSTGSLSSENPFANSIAPTYNSTARQRRDSQAMP